MNNISNENIFFSIDEEQVDKEDDKGENIILSGLLDEINNDIEFDFTNQMYNLTGKELLDAICSEYKINYTVKELLLVCDYYGLAKEMKLHKYNKDEIINVLVHFENDPINDDIFMKRQSMWYYIDNLKKDKFMKKYVLW
jgi:hypothetical protein